MKLVCRIESSSIFGAETVREMREGVLTVGRGADCGWVLNDPDRALSKQHCTITRTDDGYVLTDTSTNGVFLDGARRPLGRGQAAPLSDGSVVVLGPYRIRVSIEAGPTVEVPAALPPAITPMPQAWISEVPRAGFGEGRQPAQAGWNAPPDPHVLGATGLTMAIGFDALPPLAQQSELGSPMATMIRMPVAKSVLPPDWDIAEDDDPLAPPVIPSAAPPAPAPPPMPGGSVVEAFLDGAGLPPDLLAGADQAAAFRNYGRMLSAAVLGLRDLLGSRKLAKAELRVGATVVRASGNNALKFSLDASRALLAIAGQPTPGFLPGDEAIDEGVRDIKGHELAMVAAISTLLNEISTRLDPAAIKGKASGGGLLPVSRRAHYWDEYERAFAALVGSGGAGDGAGEPGKATLVQRFAESYAAQAQQGAGRAAGV